jgi:hypothetical protein
MNVHVDRSLNKDALAVRSNDCFIQRVEVPSKESMTKIKGRGYPVDAQAVDPFTVGRCGAEVEWSDTG